ncbi:hypothetical protein SAMN05216559_4218 [Halomicrobium zhouii]|uniref:Uncharacterized protein n=1 Tax=Halomicrobium zhouii TaxID=767519 RepID=A0A1I6MBR7_9EURY|nr:hypothetical protein [Halomicrobium zhouii]SFS13190.1 hypothetical protein SAMN05216559_4218 [Halomicrobium zhouii]
MAGGILDTIGLAGTVLFAAPVALYGADLLLGGDGTQGLIFLGIAALMVVVPRYLRTPKDVATDAVSGTAGRLVETEDEDGD